MLTQTRDLGRVRLTTRVTKGTSAALRSDVINRPAGEPEVDQAT